MKSVIRIVKREKAESSQRAQPQEKEERKQPNEREIASTIKSWITDREKHRRLTERSNWEMLTKFAQ